MIMINKELTRRQFIKDVGITCICSDLLIGAVTSRTTHAGPVQAAAANQLPSMEYKELGKTGLKVSIVSYGVMRLTDPALLFQALELGVNYFDTAHGYQNGNNEKMLGSVIKEYGRDKALIATKIKPYGMIPGLNLLQDTDELQKMVDESLRRLKTDYVDILFLHSVKDSKCPTDEKMMGFLEKQKKDGKARFVGISFHVEGNTYVEIVEQALGTNFYDVFLATHNFKSPPAHIEALRLARSKGVGIISMKTQAGGYEKDIKGDLTPHQAALRWVLDHDFVDCAIPGMVNREQLFQNVAVIGRRLSSKDKELLDAYYAAIKSHYCISCGACNALCGKGVNVQSVHRSLMYWEGYGDPDLARSSYRELSGDENAQACLNCSSPTCRCINGIKIDDRMRHAHTALA